MRGLLVRSQQEGVVVMMKRAEIDTRAPFQSVKEAVRLFGEKVIAGDEVHAHKLQQEINPEKNENGQQEESPSSSRIGTVMEELEETKHCLQKAQEESLIMAHSLASLQEELERTKRELKQIQLNETPKQVESHQIEDVKIIDDSTKFVVKSQVSNEEKVEFKKNKYVTFANPLSVSQVVMPPGVALERHPSLRKKKKKPLIPLIGGIFNKKKASQETHFPRVA